MNSKRSVGCWVNKDCGENNRLKMKDKRRKIEEKNSFMGNIRGLLSSSARLREICTTGIESVWECHIPIVDCACPAGMIVYNKETGE